MVKATDADFDAISLLANKKGMPLLMAMGGGSSDGQGRLVLQPSRGKVLLPDLQVGCGRGRGVCGGWSGVCVWSGGCSHQEGRCSCRTCRCGGWQGGEMGGMEPGVGLCGAGWVGIRVSGLGAGGLGAGGRWWVGAAG